MGTQYQQTDTAAVNGSIAACSGATLGSPTFNDQVQVGGTAGSALNTITVPSGASQACIMSQSPSGDPGLASWPSGSWVYRLNVTTADVTGWLKLDQVYICRVNSSGVSQGTVASSTGLAILLTSTGVVSVTLSGSAQTASTGDTFYVVLVFKNGHPAASKSITFKFDQLIDTPFGTTPQPIRRHQVAGGGKFRTEPPRGRNLRHRTPKASVAPTAAGTFVQFTQKHRLPKVQPFIPQIQALVPIRRGRVDRRRVPFASTTQPAGGAAVIRRHRQGQTRFRTEPLRGGAKRKRVPFIAATPPASGTFIQKRRRFVYRAPAGPPGVVLTAARMRRKRQRPNPVVAAMVVLRHRQARGWRIATSPERGRAKRLRIKPPSLPPPSGAFRRLGHRIADPQYFVPGKGRARRRRVPFAAAAPPPSGAFRRPTHRVADPPPTFVPGKGRNMRRRVPRFTRVALPVIPRHHQAQGFKRWRPEPERARKRRGRVPAIAPKLRPHRLARKSISQPPTPLLRIRSLRHRLPGAQVSTPVMRKRRPTRIAPRWRPPNFVSIRRRVPRTPPVLATVMRRHRQGRFFLPVFKGKVRRAKFYTLLAFVAPGPSPAPLLRRRRYASQRWMPEPIRGRARRRRTPSVLIVRLARRRMSAPVVRWPLFRVPWRRRRVAGVGPVQATVIRARKRRLALLFLPMVLRGKARRSKKYAPGVFIPAAPIVRRHRYALGAQLSREPRRGLGRRRRLIPSPVTSPAPVLRRRRFMSQRWTPGPVRGISKRRRVPIIGPVLATVIRSRKRQLAVLFLPFLRGKARRTTLRRPGAFIAPNPVIRRHRMAFGLWMTREPRRGYAKRRRLIPPSTISPAWLLRRRRYLFTAQRRLEPGRGRVWRVRMPKITPSVRPVLGRHRRADGWKRWFPWWLTSLRRSLRRHDRLTPFIPTPALPDLIDTPPEEMRVWVEPRRARTYIEPRRPRTWREPRRFIGRS